MNMPHEQAAAPANWNAMKFVAIAVAMASLAGCAVTMPLREIAPSGYVLAGPPDGDVTCTTDECFDRNADDEVAYRDAPIARRGKINPHDDTESNFIFQQ